MDRIEMRPRLRDEQPPGDVIVVVRGGPDTAAKLQRYAARTAAVWNLDGEPFYGVSVFCALDEIGPASLDAILLDKHSYKVVYLTTVKALADTGFELLATGTRPHFTIRVRPLPAELARLLAVFGEKRENPRNEPKTGGR